MPARSISTFPAAAPAWPSAGCRRRGYGRTLRRGGGDLGPAALALPFALALVAVLVRHPPALLVLYVYVGIFKGEPLVSDLPLT